MAPTSTGSSRRLSHRSVAVGGVVVVVAGMVVSVVSGRRQLKVLQLLREPLQSILEPALLPHDFVQRRVDVVAAWPDR